MDFRLGGTVWPNVYVESAVCGLLPPAVVCAFYIELDDFWIPSFSEIDTVTCEVTKPHLGYSLWIADLGLLSISVLYSAQSVCC